MKFVSLHSHSTFSYLDGYGTPAAHVERVAELGMGALALSEHGNTSSWVQLEKSANKANIKPIFGLEAYTAPVDMRETQNLRKWHMTIVAMDETGLQNLNRLVTRSWAEGFYRWPTITGPMLREHHEGLIITSGCADSKLACDLLGGKGRDRGDVRDARRTVAAFRDLLGDRYYLEVQQFPELERTCTLNPAYEEFSNKFGVPLVATADVHYPYPADNEMQKILHAAGRGTGTVAAAEAEWEYDILLTYPESDKALLRRLRGTGLSRSASLQALEATTEIASRCNVVLPKVEMLRYPVGADQSNIDVIWEWLREGWTFRAKTNPRLKPQKEEYVKRLQYEMELIVSKGYVDYFLMLSDAVRWCKRNGIAVGPARGSAAASLACYLLRITEVDPVFYPEMLFERFIAPDRYDLPDVDLDFDDERRDELRTYLEGKYGEACVGNIGNFTRYRGKNSLDDVARVYQIPKSEVEQVKAMIVTRSMGDTRALNSIEDTVDTFPQAKEAMERNPDLYKALRLEGNYRGMSVHAAGLVIANAPLSDVAAMYERTTGTGRKKRTRRVLSVDKYDAEYLGMLKADFLGLQTMGMIGHAIAMLGVSLEDFYAAADPSMGEDPKVIDSFTRSDVSGIFQFFGGATRIVCQDVMPTKFRELCDINALSRPGPLHSGSTNEYIQIKHGKKRPGKMHPILEELTKDTYGQIIYQEQILRIIREIGGFDWVHSAEIQKIISKKHGEAAFNMKWNMFYEGAKSLHDMPEREAMNIWKRLITAGTYAFNVAHCVSYATLAYWTMWLKVYHPAAFYAASLRKDEDHQYYLLRDAVRHGVEVRPPDLHKSLGSWWAADGAVLAGFSQIPGIGDATADKIIAEKEANPFEDWRDLERVPGIGPVTVNNIIEVATGRDPFGVTAVDEVMGQIRSAIKSGELGPLPTPTHRGADIPTGGTTRNVVYIGIPTKRDARDMVEDERARTGDSIEEIRKKLKGPVKKMYVTAIDDSDTTVFLRFSRYKYPKFQRALHSMDLGRDVILVKGTKREGFGTSIYVEQMWVIEPDQDRHKNVLLRGTMAKNKEGEA
jgi:DNA polymerase-3 subunit alpha